MRVLQFVPGWRTGGGGGPRSNRLRKDPLDPLDPLSRVLHSIWAVLSAQVHIILIRILIKFISKLFFKKKSRLHLPGPEIERTLPPKLNRQKKICPVVRMEVITENEINSLVQILEAMPTKLQLSWVAAVKKWNDAQAFKDDVYAIPKKGGESYAEVKSLREHFNDEMKEPKPEPKPEPKVEPKPQPKVIEKKTHECPICKKKFINLNEHITKIHTDWIAPAVSNKGWVVQYQIIDDESGRVRVFHNGVQATLENEVELQRLDEVGFEGWMELPTKIKKGRKEWKGRNEILWIIVPKPNAEDQSPPSLIKNNGVDTWLGDIEKDLSKTTKFQLIPKN